MESRMLRKYYLIGILAITVAQVISASSWVRINRSDGLLKGLSKDVVIVDKGERDSLSPAAPSAASLVGLPKGLVIIDKGERDSLSPAAPSTASLVGLSKGLVIIDKGERDSLSPAAPLAASQVGKSTGFIDKGERDFIP
jgi:hypothetical protein